MEIRRYRTGEEETIWGVFFNAMHVANARDYHPDLIERWASPDRDMGEWRKRLAEKNPFVAVIDGEIVGMAEVSAEGFIDYFYVHPSFHGSGIGTALLGVVEGEARRTGAGRLTADVSVTARTFFEARGFVVTESRGNVILGHPAPNFAMLKELG